MIKVHGVCRIASDLELKHTTSNIPFVAFTVAVNKSYKDKGAYFHKVIAWRLLGENLVKYQKKGSQIYLEGSLTERTYETENGNRYITEIVADNIEYLSNKGTENNYPQTDEEIDETFKHGNPTNPPKILTKAQVREDKKEKFKSSVDVQESDLPF